MTEQDQMTGAWTEFSCDLSVTDREVFAIALKGLTGVGYHPVAVATQVVAGINYDFFCNAKVVYPGASNESAMVRIYAPATGDPHLVSIHRINH